MNSRPVRSSIPVEDAVARIRAWGEAREWRGYDPYDALNSPFTPVLTFGSNLGRRILTQAVKRSPVNLRPILGIRPAVNAKALGLVASGYVRLAAAGDLAAASAAAYWLDRLRESAPCWGYHFDVQTRFFRYRAGTPNTIATSFVAQAFLDDYEFLGHERSGDVALMTAEFLVDRMLDTAPAGPYFRYLEHEDALVHNANLLACAVLARAARCIGVGDLADRAAAATATTLAAQRSDGSWPYAFGDGRDWVDNFHTGYVLESLAECEGLAPDVAEHLALGFDYWERALFLGDGTPRYDSDHTTPLDAHNYAQAIETWLSIGDRRAGALAAANRTAALLIADFLMPEGYVRFRRGRGWVNNVAFVRWTTAPAFRALARLLLVVARGTAVAAAGSHKDSGARLD